MTTESRAASGELQRRIRAARAYAGYSLDEMAAAVGIGRQTLVRIEQGIRPPKRMELREIAAVSGLPVEFFSADFAVLAEAPGGLSPEALVALERIRDDVDRLVRAGRARPDGGLPEPPQGLVGDHALRAGR